MRLVVALLCVLSGCVRAELLECGDKLCSPSQTCVVDRCVDPALVCTQPGAECDALGAPGRCIDSVCEPASCGNGYIDTPLREDCDGTVPDLHCVDVGFDLGRPGCTACQIDLRVGCTSFGWRLAVNSPAQKLWTDGETYAYWRFEPSSLEVHGPSVDISMPVLTIFDIQGGGGRIVVTGPNEQLDIIGGQIAALALPQDVPADGIDAFDVTPDGTLTVVSNCALYSQAIGGAWVTGPKVPTTNCVQLEQSGGQTIVVTRTNEIWMVKSGVFQRRFTLGSTVTQVVYGAVSGMQALWIGSTGGLYFAIDGDNTPKELFTETAATSVALADGVVYAMAEDIGTIVRWDGQSIGRLIPPSNKAITSDGEHLVAYRGPIYEFSGIDFSSRTEVGVIALQDQPSAILEPPARKQATVVTSYSLQVPDPKGEGWTRLPDVLMAPLSIRAAAGVSEFTVYSAYLSPPDDNRHQTLGLQTAGGIALVSVPTDPFIHGLWVSPDHEIFAAGDDEAGRGFLGIRTPDGTWSTFSPSGACSIHGIHASVRTSVYAVGACDGEAVVWRYDGSDWSEAARFTTLATLAAVRVLVPDIVVAVGPNGLARLDGAMWSIDSTVTGRVLSGTPDDLWVSGSFTNVQRYDGTSWSQMTTRSLSPIYVIADGRRVLLPGAAPGFAELLR